MEKGTSAFLHENIVVFLQFFPNASATVEGGGMYYVTEKEELFYSGPLSTDTEPVFIGHWEEEKLLEVWEALRPINHSAISPEVVHETPTFEVEGRIDVVSQLPGEKEEVVIGRIVHGTEKLTGAKGVVVAAGSLAVVLTIVEDAEGNVSPAFVADLMAFSDAIAQMADVLSRKYYHVPLINTDDEELGEIADSVLLPR